ncbi:MipA/OmpV family protein [Sphingomonas sp. 37zxx]|uniref:MipA/OmpV family protein n=1 Tax=Sphingomonas sp. 37zxx TaxID=1550073 RepID=UPI000690D26F|nr:MipA/OmpV family protein [Sphingomonas sp. 37zxx]
MKLIRPLALALLAAGSFHLPAANAQENEPRRTRIALGPQLVPSYPGSDSFDFRPFVDLSRTRGDIPFAFEAPDEGGGLPLLTKGSFQFGPAFGFEGRRRGREVGGLLPDVGFTVELGGFVQYAVIDSVRVRVEARQGIGGHQGMVANISADYIARDADRWLFSVGPRMTLTNRRYNRAFFDVAAADAAQSGLPAHATDGGIQALGATAGLLRQLTPTWGIYGYTKYDRLVGDPADSPLVREFGSRNQFSGGLALTYSFASRAD